MAGDRRISGFEQKLETYLKRRFGQEARLRSIRKAGEGIHGVAYRVDIQAAGREYRWILKTLGPVNFGHDHFSDRAQVLLLAHANYNELDRHVRSLDVLGEANDGFISLEGAEEFFILMEEAQGRPYFDDLNAVLKRGRLRKADRVRALALADFLLETHKVTYRGENAGPLYRRRIRDLVGHGECVMGIIDAYGDVAFTRDAELIEYAGKCLAWWGRIRNLSHRLCRVHGDYHPGNIWFDGDRLTLLDRSRGSWGEPADDVSCLALNYLHYAVKDRGAFDGPFAELFREFLDRYMRGSGDDPILTVIQPFFAFRVLVVANPAFYPDDSAETKRKLMNFGQSVLAADRFDIDGIGDYLRGS